MEKVDARILKSKKAIQDAFKELIQTKEIQDISVSELIAKSGVTRSTYYLYYQKVTDVVDEIEDNIVKKISNLLSDTDLVKCMLDPYPLLNAIFEEIIKEDAESKYIFLGKGSNFILDGITDKIVTAYDALVLKHMAETHSPRTKYLATFMVSGICSCFKLWYLDGRKMTLEDFSKELSGAVKKAYSVLSITN